MTGETHFLNELPLLLLETLEDRQSGTPDILAELADGSELEASAETAILMALELLRSAELIQTKQ